MPFSLKFVIPLLLTIFLAAQSGIVVYFALNELDRNIETQNLENLNQQMQRLQTAINHYVNANELELIQQEITATGVDIRIITAILVDDKGVVFSSIRLSQREKHFTEVLKTNTAKIVGDMKELKYSMQGRVFLSQGRDTIVGLYPVIFGISEGKIKPDKIGMIIIEKEIASLKSNSRVNLSYKLLLVIGFILIVALLMWLFLHHMVTRRIMMLITLSQFYSKGEYDKQFHVGGNDEITTLSIAFHEMASKIEYSHEQLEQKVQVRTGELVEANEKLKELDKLKSLFIASMSHELRTPLNSIIGFSDVILNGMTGEINEKQKDYLSRVNKAGSHLLAIITDVIDISKIEAGRIPLNIEDFQLSEVVEEAIEESKILIKNKPLTLNAIVPQRINLHSDRRLLKQCLFNFLSNAIKYSESGDITLSVEQQENGWIVMKVSDHGIGIRAEDMPNLFKAFERFESHLKVLAGGSGLGLYLSKKIVENLLEGEMFVESTLGEGSTFGLRIPKVIDKSEL